MNDPFFKSTGLSLVSGSILIIVTMVLHPTGGQIDHLLEISNTIIISHSLAILCLPMIAFGFYGLSIKLLDKYKIVILAFIVITFGLIAAMLAALVNGLALPHFLNQYAETRMLDEPIIKLIMNYGFSLNKSLDYIFIIASCLAITIYSIIIIRSKRMPPWLGYYGITILIFSSIGGIMGFAFTSLIGFRIFTFSLAGWIVLSGIILIRLKQTYG